MIRLPIFVGRTRELSALDALARSSTRLVTLWGPGGAGKTRLARRFAELQAAAGIEIVWVDLAAARTEAETTATLSASLGVVIDGGDEPREALARSFAAHRGWIVADNVEQLDDAARAALIDLSTAAGANGARLLVTSQRALGARDEETIEVESLLEPDALTLYTTLSGTNPDDDARAIVRRLDALPLAIELAAARAPLLGSAELLSRLDRKLDLLGGPGAAGRPERHATLRAAIAWSWELLEDSDRVALATCALFEAPFDAPLAERALARVAVFSGAEDPTLRAMDALERLRQRALVHVGAADASGRPELRLLESVRDFARAAIDPALRRAWAEAVLERAEPLAATVRRGGAIPTELARRRADLLLLAGDREQALAARAMLSLAALLQVTGPLDVVVARAEALAAGVTDPDLGARLAIAKGLALRAMGRHVEAAAAADAALAREVTADALRLAGMVARSRGETARAIELLERAKDRYDAEGERAFAGICLAELGAAHQSEGRTDVAIARQAEAIAIHVAEKTTRAEGVARSYLAVATHRAGDPASAIALHEAALAIHRRAGHKRLEGAELLHLGFVSHELGGTGAAREAFGEARRVLAGAGARGLEALALVFLARLDVDEGNLGAARIALAEAQAASPRGWARLASTRLVVAGHLAFRQGDHAAAARSYEAALEASRDVEVGFEALTPAYLALALARTRADAATALAEARVLVARVTNPHVVEALAILEGAVAGRSPTGSPHAIGSSSDVRRALSFAGTGAGLVIADEARRIVLPGGRAVDLSRRKNVRLLLVTLAEARRDRPGTPVDGDTLIAAGWPGERMRPDAATKRLHTAIWTLRSLGLEEVLVSSGDGYFLDPTIPIRVS